MISGSGFETRGRREDGVAENKKGRREQRGAEARNGGEILRDICVHAEVLMRELSRKEVWIVKEEPASAPGDPGKFYKQVIKCGARDPRHFEW